MASGVPERYLLTDKTRNWKGPLARAVRDRSLGPELVISHLPSRKGDQTREQIVERAEMVVRAVAEDARLEGTAPMADLL